MNVLMLNCKRLHIHIQWLEYFNCCLYTSDCYIFAIFNIVVPEQCLTKHLFCKKNALDMVKAEIEPFSCWQKRTKLKSSETGFFAKEDVIPLEESVFDFFPPSLGIVFPMSLCRQTMSLIYCDN